MRKFNNPRVFDEFLMGTTTYYTSSEFNELLGSADQLAIIAVTDAYAGGAGPTLTVQIQVSGDGRNWVNKNATAEINAKSISASATSVVWGSDGGTNPAMGFARLAVSAAAGAGVTQAHVRIGVCAREKEKAVAASSLTAPAFAASTVATRPTSGAGQQTASTPATKAGGGCACKGNGGNCSCGPVDRNEKKPFVVQMGRASLELWGLEPGSAELRSTVTVNGRTMFETSHARTADGTRQYVRYGPDFLGGTDLEVQVENGIVSGNVNGRPLRPATQDDWTLAFLDGGPSPECDLVPGAAEQVSALFSLAAERLLESGAPEPHSGDGNLPFITNPGPQPPIWPSCGQAAACRGSFLQCVASLMLQHCSPSDIVCIVTNAVLGAAECGPQLLACLAGVPDVGGGCCDPTTPNSCCDGTNCMIGHQTNKSCPHGNAQCCIRPGSVEVIDRTQPECDPSIPNPCCEGQTDPKYPNVLKKIPCTSVGGGHHVCCRPTNSPCVPGADIECCTGKCNINIMNPGNPFCDTLSNAIGPCWSQADCISPEVCINPGKPGSHCHCLNASAACTKSDMQNPCCSPMSCIGNICM